MDDASSKYDTGAFKRATTKKSYEFNRTVIGDAPEAPRLPSNKKNTRRWCKGVVGREHVKSWVYAPVFWHFGRPKNGGPKEPYVPPPLPEDQTPDQKRQWSLHDPFVVEYCSVCQKQIRLKGSAELRRAGVPILTEIPS